MNHKRVYSLTDLPEGEHFVILEFSTIWIEGDERSRTHPGHGYSGHSKSMVEYIAYQERADWESEIHQRVTKEASKNWVAIIAKRPSITTQTTVTVL